MPSRYLIYYTDMLDVRTECLWSSRLIVYFSLCARNNNCYSMQGSANGALYVGLPSGDCLGCWCIFRFGTLPARSASAALPTLTTEMHMVVHPVFPNTLTLKALNYFCITHGDQRVFSI